MQGAEQEGQNMRVMKRNLLLLMRAAGCARFLLKSPLKGVFFLRKSAVTPPPAQDNGDEVEEAARGRKS